MTKPSFALRLLFAGLCGLVPISLHAQNPQQLVFTGLRASASQGQFNSVKIDASANLYLLLAQNSAIPPLNTTPTPTPPLPAPTAGTPQSPARRRFQTGLAEKFNPTGTTLLYAPYPSGLNGDPAPPAIAADASDHAYITGYTTSSGYPTLAALIPEILATTSGFLTKLTPAGDGILFSTFIPGSGPTSLALALDTAT